MERNSFNNLLDNYTSLTRDEAIELIQLSQEFPYCQSIHNLAARAAQDNNLDSKVKLLNISAMYSTDRSALKSMMTASFQIRTPLAYAPATVHDEVVQFIPEVVVAGNEAETDKLRQQILDDIALMHESKRLYEEVIEKMEGHEPIPLASASIKAHQPIENLDSGDGHHEGLIEEIKSSKKKIKPETDKQIEQIQIIDQFIKTQPSIPRPKAIPTVETRDLAEPTEIFGVNIISETLVEILLKQGKREKAIEILKKLIWKYPQKKTYFASQIEDLRK